MSGIENLAGSAFNDTLTGDANDNILVGGLGNDSLFGGAGNNTYKDFLNNFGADTINDNAGISDVLNLSNYNTSVISWSAIDTDSDTFVDSLRLDFGSGNSITLQNYFNDVSSNPSLSSTSNGYIESIIFADNSSVDINDVQGFLV